jgi:enoyl-CoA hydratase/carnithine racemase
MTYFLPRVVGPSKATELLMLDPMIKPAEALELGLVTKVVPANALMDEARAMAEELAAKAPHYIRMSKILASQSINNSLADHLQVERHGIADSMGTEDLAEGVRAFFAGEQPTFSGR